MSVAVLVVLLYCRSSEALGGVTVHLDGLSLRPCTCAGNSSEHIPQNAIPTRIEVFNNEVFLAYPRYRKGVSITLGVLDLQSARPTVNPFPSQPMQSIGDCRCLQSVEDVHLDARGVLWALDTGVLGSLERACCSCPPKVVGLCARTGTLLHVVELSRVLGPRARPQYIAAEHAEDGSVYVYVSDADGASLWCLRVRGAAVGEGPVRLRLPAPAGCDALELAHLQNMLLLHCRGSPDTFAVQTARLRAGQLGAALTALGPAPSGADLVFLGTDRCHTLYYRLEGGSDVWSWDTRRLLTRGTRVPAALAPGARLTATSAAAVGRSALALAVDLAGYAARRLPCAGAEATLFSLH